MYLDWLSKISQSDIESLEKSEKSYGNSWMKRGGVGAFMMLARKWDRLEKFLQPKEDDASRGLEYLRKKFKSGLEQISPIGNTGEILYGVQDLEQAIRILNEAGMPPYDIFAAIGTDTRGEGILDDIRDLRRYLLLVEAEMCDRGAVEPSSTTPSNAENTNTYVGPDKKIGGFILQEADRPD